MNLATVLPARLDLPFSGLLHRRIAALRVTLTPAQGERHRLQKGATLVVARPQGWTLECEQGSLWITHDGDPKDILLAPGQSHVAERSSRMLVHALGDSALRLVDAAGSQPTDEGLHARLQTVITRLMKMLTRRGVPMGSTHATARGWNERPAQW